LHSSLFVLKTIAQRMTLFPKREQTFFAASFACKVFYNTLVHSNHCQAIIIRMLGTQRQLLCKSALVLLLLSSLLSESSSSSLDHVAAATCLDDSRDGTSTCTAAQQQPNNGTNNDLPKEEEQEQEAALSLLYEHRLRNTQSYQRNFVNRRTPFSWSSTQKRSKQRWRFIW
jgi:hypothetical protein